MDINYVVKLIGEEAYLTKHGRNFTDKLCKATIYKNASMATRALNGITRAIAYNNSTLSKGEKKDNSQFEVRQVLLTVI